MSPTGIIIDRGRPIEERDNRMVVEMEIVLPERLRPLHALKNAEAGNGDPLALGNRALDRVEDRVHGLHSLLTPYRKPLGNGIDQLGLVHVFPPRPSPDLPYDSRTLPRLVGDNVIPRAREIQHLQGVSEPVAAFFLPPRAFLTLSRAVLPSRGAVSDPLRSDGGRQPGRAIGFEFGDVGLMAQRQSDVVQTLHETPPGEVVNLERRRQTSGLAADLALIEVDCDGGLGVPLHCSLEGFDVCGRQLHW